MSGLFRRIRRTRAAAAEESRTESPAPSEPQDATTTAERPSGGSLLVDPATPRPTTTPPSPLAEMRDLPAGLEVEELRSPRPATERRSRLRRRTRYLRRVRELLLRDLGGLVYEIHRSTGGDRGHHEGLVRAKAERLAALDAELFALEKGLGAEHPETVLREAGVGGSCPSCGELHSSDARFCFACGTPLTGQAAVEEPAPEAPAPAAAAESEAPTGVEPPTEVAAEEPRAQEPHAEEPGAEETRVEEPQAAEEEPRGDGRDTRFTSNGREATNPDFAVKRRS
jgi:hypothetical protein